MPSAKPPCLASRDDGTLCREPATIPDPERGGLVCWQHDPERWRRFCWDEEDAEGLTITGPEGEPLADEDDEEGA
jgi:hypothetical protein